MDDSRALPPGSIVADEWRIERMLGAGGFGVTYEARHATTAAHVALKEYMPSGLCTRVAGSSHIAAAAGPAGNVFSQGLHSFMKEAEALARLDHPSIVRVTKFFEANGTAYMALAFEAGGSLAQWLAKLRSEDRQPTQEQLDRLLWPILGALIQLHSIPLLHRDIKPDNIMLRPAAGGQPKGNGDVLDGTPVLIDFGAVKSLVSSQSRKVDGPRTLNVATDGYAPPEQYVADGEGLLGPWTDVYALGATIYEAIAGKRPPDANRRNVEDNYRPLGSMVLAGWRPGFLATVDQALSLKRADRPQSIVEFRRALGVVAPQVALALPEPSRPAISEAHRIPIVAAPARATAPVPNQPASTAAPLRQPSAHPRPVDQNFKGPRSTKIWKMAAGIVALLVAGGGYLALSNLLEHRQILADLRREADVIKERNASRQKELEKTRQEAAEIGKQAKSLEKLNKQLDEKLGPAASAPAKSQAPRTGTAASGQPTVPSRDPIVALAPGSGQSARDRLVDGSECSFCPEMVVVPAGPFTMGSPASEPQRDSDESQVQVTIPRPFAVGKFAVTFDEWDACVADGGCGGYKPADQGWGRGKRPVINVNWNDAKVYAAWLSVKTGKTYRLPSETEREYFARAGTTTPFWWGSSITPAQANYDGNFTYTGSGSKGEYRQRTVPVDSFQANPWGLFNVHGNVWEWTEDCWIDRNTGNGEARTTGCTDASRRVVRGGSWFSYPRYLRSADRYEFTSDYRVSGLGFRLARTL